MTTDRIGCLSILALASLAWGLVIAAVALVWRAAR